MGQNGQPFKWSNQANPSHWGPNNACLDSPAEDSTDASFNQKTRSLKEKTEPSRQEHSFSLTCPPQTTVPFVFNSPHSGRHYTPHFLKQTQLSPLTLRMSEDVLVDQLFQFAPDLGAPLLAANFPRAFVDLNREPFELDPKLFKGPVPSNANQKSARVAAGLGTIARVVGQGFEIYRSPLSLEEALWRIGHYYLPYHAQLRDLLDNQVARFKIAVLIDCHSMPSRQNHLDHTPIPDIIIGDRFGTSASQDLVSHLIQLLKSQGVSVKRNEPYAGGYITEHYGQPSMGIHAIQVEINRALYIDEPTLEPHTGFLSLGDTLHEVFSTYVQDVSNSLQVPVAAE